jgi:phosphoribosylpyrophosphate synthetase
MAKGDQVLVVLRGVENPVIVSTDKSGRKLATDSSKEQGVNWILIHEKTWTDRIVKTSKFAAADVVAMISNFEESDA